jgi:hypothetical protein
MLPMHDEGDDDCEEDDRSAADAAREFRPDPPPGR